MDQSQQLACKILRCLGRGGLHLPCWTAPEPCNQVQLVWEHVATCHREDAGRRRHLCEMPEYARASATILPGKCSAGGTESGQAQRPRFKPNIWQQLPGTDVVLLQRFEAEPNSLDMSSAAKKVKHALLVSAPCHCCNISSGSCHPPMKDKERRQALSLHFTELATSRHSKGKIHWSLAGSLATSRAPLSET